MFSCGGNGERGGEGGEGENVCGVNNCPASVCMMHKFIRILRIQRTEIVVLGFSISFASGGEMGGWERERKGGEMLLCLSQRAYCCGRFMSDMRKLSISGKIVDFSSEFFYRIFFFNAPGGKGRGGGRALL